MAKFKKITFKGLISQFKNRFRMVPVSSGANLYDMYPERGTVTQQGDEITAEGMNQLQDNIADAFSAVYDSDVSDGRYAPAITGQLEGERVYADDAAAGYALAKAVFYGETTESGSGEKSPSNPYTMIQRFPGKITVSGKNLYDDGNPNLLEAYITSGEITSSASARTLYIPCDGNTAYTVSRQTISARLRIGTTEMAPNSGTNMLQYIEADASRNVTITTAQNAKYLLVFYFNGNFDTAVTEDKIRAGIQIETGTQATAYEAYTGASYTMPDMTLRSVGNTKDEYDVLSGILTRRITAKQLLGTENYVKLDANCNAESNLYYLTNVPIGGSYTDILCSHLPTSSITAASKTNNGIYANPDGNMFYFRLRLDTGITSVDEVKAWMASQAAAGTPVRIYYIAKTETQEENTPQYITQPASTMTICADAPLDIAYNKDANMVISSLDKRIGQLETAMATLLGGE